MCINLGYMYPVYIDAMVYEQMYYSMNVTTMKRVLASVAHGKPEVRQSNEQHTKFDYFN